MVVHSDCKFEVDETHVSLVTDVVSYDWMRVLNVELDEDCKLKL
jgi:hypothetical protein